MRPVLLLLICAACGAGSGTVISRQHTNAGYTLQLRDNGDSGTRYCLVRKAQYDSITIEGQPFTYSDARVCAIGHIPWDSTPPERVP